MKKPRDEVYEFLVEGDEPRACNTIPDEDCHHVSGNFLKNIANGTLTKLAEKIISPDITLAWVFNSIGASSSLVGMLVPIKDLGSLLPQLALSGHIRSKPIRKWYWVLAACIQALCLVASGIVLLYGSGPLLPWVLAGLLLMFSISSGMGSVSFKDVTGKTIPKGQRGQMLSLRSTLGGILGVGAGSLLIFEIPNPSDTGIYAGMFFIAAALWFISAWIFARINEMPGATSGGRTPLMELKSGLDLVQKDTDFQRFLMTRALLMAIPLLQPFYVLLAKRLQDLPTEFLGWLILISGISQVIASPIWGKIADKNPAFLMRVSAGISVVGILYALSFTLKNPLFTSIYWFLPVFFINGFAYAGARLSRKTYLVDYAPDNERPTYVSVANTTIGLYTIFAGSFGLVSSFSGLGGQLIFFLILLIFCILLSFKLRQV